MLDSLQGAQTVILHEQFRSYMNGFRQQPLRYGKVELLEYLPGKVIYRTVCDSEQVIVFSEMWHKGNKHWEVKIDGQPSTHVRANYLLRAMWVPAGEHIISFDYRPQPYYLGEKIAKAGSVFWLLLLLVIPIFINLKRFSAQN